MDCGTAFVLEMSHWPRDRDPAGQLSHWSSTVCRGRTFALEMYSFRGSFDDSMVGAEKIPTKQGTSQSCDEEHVAVDVHRVMYSTIHLDVVSIHCEDLGRVDGGVLHAAFLLVGEHVDAED